MDGFTAPAQPQRPAIPRKAPLAFVWPLRCISRVQGCKPCKNTLTSPAVDLAVGERPQLRLQPPLCIEQHAVAAGCVCPAARWHRAADSDHDRVSTDHCRKRRTSPAYPAPVPAPAHRTRPGYVRNAPVRAFLQRRAHSWPQTLINSGRPPACWRNPAAGLQDPAAVWCCRLQSGGAATPGGGSRRPQAPPAPVSIDGHRPRPAASTAVHSSAGRCHFIVRCAAALPPPPGSAGSAARSAARRAVHHVQWHAATPCALPGTW